MGKADVKPGSDVGNLLNKAGSLVKELRTASRRTDGRLKPRTKIKTTAIPLKEAPAR